MPRTKPRAKQIILPIVFPNKKMKEKVQFKLRSLAAGKGLDNGPFLAQLLEVDKDA